MEELIDILGGVEVTKYPNNPSLEHPRFSLFKLKSSGSSQEQRRLRILDARKQARYDVVSHLRKLEDNVRDEDDEEEDMDAADNVAVCYARPNKYRNFAMLSEWLVEVPEDFSATYLALPCPVGKRSIVVSARGRTCTYAKNGKLMSTYPSHLPGGSYGNSKQGYTCLDCIWSPSNKTYYVIDIMVWLRQSLIECETDFRFEWLKWRLNELDKDISVESPDNPYKFVRVPTYACTPESLSEMIQQKMPFDVELDGVLFYHKSSHYTHGPTPLVGWLKGYMFPEILKLEVPEHYMKMMPSKYVNLSAHMEYSKQIAGKKKKKEKMDTSTVEESTVEES